jgi:hypothetical protein
MRDSTKLVDTSACDSDIDGFFKDTLYVTGCLDYRSCKDKWYREDFKRHLLRPGNAEYIRPDSGTIVAEYAKAGFSSAAAKARARAVLQVLRAGKVPVFMPSWAPEGRNGFPLIYDAKAGRFIEVGGW